jgi:hypothetical protein
MNKEQLQQLLQLLADMNEEPTRETGTMISLVLVQGNEVMCKLIGQGDNETKHKIIQGQTKIANALYEFIYKPKTQLDVRENKIIKRRKE